jgi:hypothetical protein
MDRDVGPATFVFAKTKANQSKSPIQLVSEHHRTARAEITGTEQLGMASQPRAASGKKITSKSWKYW